MRKSLGIYIHIPFCLQKCRYCDFCSFGGRDRGYMRQYTDELCRRIEGAAESAGDYSVDTVYFGGGTPSLLPIDCIERIMLSLGKYELAENAEITLECNPATADGAYFGELRKIGINRLSIGLQSTHDSELALLGRAHSYAEFVGCYADARSAGFENISVDLMYGIPSQTSESFRISLERLISLSPEHISAYGLTVEEGTYFHTHREELDLADDDTQAELYCLMNEVLESGGYHRYEISNFARAERQSRHNTRYWKCSEYLGFGVAAHSYFGGKRFGNSRDIGAFMRGEDICEECELIGESERRSEFVMLGLRLTAGIDKSEYFRLFARDFDRDFPLCRDFEKGGFMYSSGDRLMFTQRGFLVSNEILSRLL